MNIKRIHFRVSLELQESIKQKAELAGLSNSELIRKSLQNLTIAPVLPLTVISSLAGWGRNLNQLALKANQSNQIDLQAVQNLRADAAHIIQLLSAKNNKK